MTSKRTSGLSIESFNKMHEKSKKYIINTVNSSTKPTIIVTHFPPLQIGTSDPIYDDQEKNIKDYFASNILNDEKLDKSKISCWIYGHTHYSNDFVHDGVRLISNQIGYMDEKCEFNDDGIVNV